MTEQKGESEMPTVPVPDELTVEHLMAAVKQLSPAEWREFQRQLGEWQQQNGRQDEPEAELLALIEENSQLPKAEQQRFNRLRRKRQAETLMEPEQAELQSLWRRVEQMNVIRLEALTKLARRRKTDVKTLMSELGLPENKGVF